MDVSRVGVETFRPACGRDGGREKKKGRQVGSGPETVSRGACMATDLAILCLGVVVDRLCGSLPGRRARKPGSMPPARRIPIGA